MAGAGLTAASISFFGATTAAGIAAATAASFAVTGAAVGALSAAVTGGDIGRGALIGGITGALTSGFAPGGFGGVEGSALAGGGFSTSAGYGTIGSSLTEMAPTAIETVSGGGSGIWSSITSSLSNATLGESLMIGQGLTFAGGLMKGQGQYQAGQATGARQDFLATDKERVAVFNKAASGRDVTENLIATSGKLARNRLLRSSGGFQGSTGTYLDLGNSDRRDRIYLANLVQEQGEIDERALLTERDLLRQDADAARAQGSFERTSTIITAAGSLLT
jgi:hypothetical protein